MKGRFGLHVHRLFSRHDFESFFYLVGRLGRVRGYIFLIYVFSAFGLDDWRKTLKCVRKPTMGTFSVLCSFRALEKIVEEFYDAIE